MKRYLFIILGIAILSALAYTVFSTFFQSKIIILKKDGFVNLNVDIARTDKEKIEGLSNRKYIPENYGMLFIFDKEDYPEMWMRNTLISLDMIFISSNFRIVDIKHAYPCKKDPCEIYKPGMRSKYVLEVNGNLTIKKDINIGDRINIYLT